MARLLEDQALELLSQLEIPVPAFTVAANAAEAETAAALLEKEVVLKALVAGAPPGTTGTIRFARTPSEAKVWAKELLEKQVGGRRPDRLLVVEKVDAAQELYLSFSLEVGRRRIVVTVSAEGGLDFADLAEERPESIHRLEVDPGRGLPEYRTREVWAAAGLREQALLQAAALTHRLYEGFLQYDATFLELNPLALTEYGELMPGGVEFRVDDAALFRQPDLKGWVEEEAGFGAGPGSASASASGSARFIELEGGGDLGLLCGWGPASLAAFDAVVSAGGRPANYAEFGARASETQCYGLAKVVLAQPGLKGLLVTGNLNLLAPVDVQARGILRAIRELKLDLTAFPVVVRQPGVNDGVARKLWEDAGAEWHGEDLTLGEAAERIVRRTLAERGPAEGGRH
jgi:succinyl-CoA synthetase beta subunit/citryl-CoA synthetase large subunit